MKQLISGICILFLTATVGYCAEKNPLSLVQLTVGMPRAEAEKRIETATGTPSAYDLYAMDISKEVKYHNGNVTLTVHYKPGTPAPAYIVRNGQRSPHIPPVDGEVISWEFT